jgi:hypothetical protein
VENNNIFNYTQSAEQLNGWLVLQGLISNKCVNLLKSLQFDKSTRLKILCNIVKFVITEVIERIWKFRCKLMIEIEKEHNINHKKKCQKKIPQRANDNRKRCMGKRGE